MFLRLKVFLTRFTFNGKRLLYAVLALAIMMILLAIHSTQDKKVQLYRSLLDAEPLSSDFNSWNLNQNKTPIILEDVLLSDLKPPLGRTIFFLETSCYRTESQNNMQNFTTHQACAIESAALHNPNFEVFILFACPTSRPQNNLIINAILSYKNVQLRQLNLWHFAAGTPIEDWLKKDDLFRSRYLMYHLSDLLRFLTLYHYGGIYFDMDVMVLRSFEDEPMNFVGAETKTSIGNSVISLAPNGVGHKVGKLLLQDFIKNYAGDKWAHNGPECIVRVMKKICGTNNVKIMQEDRSICRGFKVFDVHAFYEINWIQWLQFFEPSRAKEALRRLSGSYLTHIWNHINTKWPLSIYSGAAYIQLAEQHCPRVFAATGKYFN